MKGSIKVRVGLAAAAIGAVAVAALPASASTGAATINGTGNISPGLTVGGGTQSFTFAGSGTAATDTYQGSFSCSVTGNDTVGSIAQGAGAFNGTCTAGATTEPVTGNYTRVGGVVVLSNGIIGPGPVSGSFTGVCSFEATSAPTVTSYDVQCHVAVH